MPPVQFWHTRCAACLLPLCWRCRQPTSVAPDMPPANFWRARGAADPFLVRRKLTVWVAAARDVPQLHSALGRATFAQFTGSGLAALPVCQNWAGATLVCRNLTSSTPVDCVALSVHCKWASGNFPCDSRPFRELTSTSHASRRPCVNFHQLSVWS